MAQIDATEQLKEKGAEMLVKMIDFTVQSMNDVIEFSKQQIPDVIHQLLMWKATNAGVWMIFGIIFLVLAFMWGKKVNKWIAEDPDAIPAHIPTLILLVIGGYNFIDNLLTILQIVVAPKIYLIEYASDLIKSH